MSLLRYDKLKVFGLWTNKMFEVIIIITFGTHWSAFFTIFWHFIHRTTHLLFQQITNRLTDNENNHSLQPKPWNSWLSELMWAVIKALLFTWLDSLVHSMLCAVACWCWKPPSLRLSEDTFYLPPGRKSPRYLGSSQRSPGVCDCSCLKRRPGSKSLSCVKHL